MALISNTSLLAYLDKLASGWLQLLTTVGSKANALSAGTVRNTANNLLTLVLGLNDFEQDNDLLVPVNQTFGRASLENSFGMFSAAAQGLNNHLALRGLETSNTIVDLSSYLTYFNGGGGGARFSCLVTPETQTLWTNLLGVQLPTGGCMSDALQPDWNSAAPLGMGTCTVSGFYTAGMGVNTALYAEVTPILEVIANCNGGFGTLAVTVTGVDNTGATGTWSASVVTGGNNPVAALAGITVVPSVGAYARNTVVLSSTVGIVPGSVLTINKGLVDQEVIVVEAVPQAGQITAVFKVAHAGGASVSGWTSTSLVPSVAGRRLRTVTGIAPTTQGQSMGTVRIAGARDRVAV
jgi:hypothetical protein